MNDEFEQRLNSVLRTGRLPSSDSEEIEDVEVELTIRLLRLAAKNYADFLLQKIAAIASGEMITLATAILLANAPEQYLANPLKKSAIRWLLTQMSASQLLEIVEYLKSNVMGRGLGSRPQKLIRAVMESWSEKTIEGFIISEQDIMKCLVRLIHPRYRGRRGELIKILMKD